ncbi:MAG: hypothetical protein OEV85_11265, partial [Candidatus Thorarchaeota archaeon]|nr:hypothetical protein [Candidatus Thorarchaeota archaeon]
MKPIGSVTMYFPFLEKTTCDELNSLMNQAQTLWEFASSLSERVCSSNKQEELAFLALLFATELGQHEFLEKMSYKYQAIPAFHPFLLLGRTFLDRTVDYDLVINSVDLAMSISPKSWMAIELLDAKAFAGFMKRGWTSEEDQVLEEMKRLIESDEKLNCFKHITHDWEARIWDREGKTDKFIEEMESALKVTRAYDDKMHEASILQYIARSKMNSDANAAKELLIESRTIFKALGNWNSFALVQHGLGLIQGIRGEFDDALESFFDAAAIKGEAGRPIVDTMYSTAIPHDIAFIYNELGEGRNALEWSKLGLDEAKSVPRSYAEGLMQIAWALIHINKIEEARKIIDELGEIVFKAGDDTYLPLHDFAQGLLEIKEGNLKTASQSLSQALRLCIATNRMALTNSCFLKLAEIELKMVQSGNYDVSFEMPQSWMNRLEEHAREKDYPGIRMLHALLKAEYQT